MLKGVILMTALIPTVGHQKLIDFAYNFMSVRSNFNSFELKVIVSSRSFEPVPGTKRVGAFDHHYQWHRNIEFMHHADDNAPQTPSTQAEWDYWKDTIMDAFGINLKYGDDPKIDFLFASEFYGKVMASHINAEFIPFDIDRQFNGTRGTHVRKDIIENWDCILPEFRRNLLNVFTMFGQESTGKTTMTKRLVDCEFYGISRGIHEFARPYIEMKDDITITHEIMCGISDGQYALQQTARFNSDVPIIFQDTDLLSTIGYNRIYGGEPLPDIEFLFNHTKSDIYFVMNDEIPFEEDPLRYGGKVRESTKQFWIDLLGEFNCTYYVVESTDIYNQEEEIEDVVRAFIKDRYRDIVSFVRD